LYSKSPDAKQKLIPHNYTASFEPTPIRSELLAIHLHGWVGQPDTDFVFSLTEYARSMRQLNPWMHLVSEILGTESFIIAGTSLNEVDLEYYLSHRSDATPRRDKGPSLLIEPYPDAATVSDCKRFGLTLVKSTFGEFLNWLQREIPTPPSLSDLIVPHVDSIFPNRKATPQLLRFFSDFQMLKASDQQRSHTPSPFMYGRAIQQDDLDQHIDIQRNDSGRISAVARRMIDSASRGDVGLLIIYDEAGSGKTTLLRRIGHDLARAGQPVLALHSLSGINAHAAIDSIHTSARLLVILVDGIADHAEQVNTILRDPKCAGKVVVMASERSYRREYVDLVLADLPRTAIELFRLTNPERRTLIELYREFGLIANPDALHNPGRFADRLEGDPISVAVCRILNDFLPLEAIVNTLWDDTSEPLRNPYLCVALAHHCHVAGIRYSILQAICGVRCKVSELFTIRAALGIVCNPEDDEYVIPLSAVLADRVLHRVSRQDPGAIFDAFVRIADGLAPHVNRTAIICRTPEARLAKRLFDCDKVVIPFLGADSEKLFIAAQRKWEWNSRYWEQRALLVGESDLDRGLSYARHGVAIEEHPFPLTTLGKLLVRKMEREPTAREATFEEAIATLAKAIRIEAGRSRVTVHPYFTLLSGAARFVELGGVLTASQRTQVLGHIANSRHVFPLDSQLSLVRDRLESML
jgi:hypothetical protein